MNPERLAMELLMIAYSISPYEARNAVENTLRTPRSLDKQIITHAHHTYKNLGQQIVDRASNPEDIVIRKEHERAMEVAVLKLLEESRLSDKQRKAFELAMDGLDPTAIADMLGYQGKDRRQSARSLLVRAINKVIKHPDFSQVTELRFKQI
jgi:hypothetical protein